MRTARSGGAVAKDPSRNRHARSPASRRARPYARRRTAGRASESRTHDHRPSATDATLYGKAGTSDDHGRGRSRRPTHNHLLLVTPPLFENAATHDDDEHSGSDNGEKESHEEDDQSRAGIEHVRTLSLLSRGPFVGEPAWVRLGSNPRPRDHERPKWRVAMQSAEGITPAQAPCCVVRRPPSFAVFRREVAGPRTTSIGCTRSCSVVSGHTVRSAAQEPSVPSPTATIGAGIPRRLRSRSRSAQLSVDSR